MILPFRLGLAALLSTCLTTQAAQVLVAVAANFAPPMQRIALAFEQETGHKAVLSLGSTGSFYAQIRNGAPFQVLLAADDETPIKIEDAGLGVSGSRFTYAIGRLVLWSPQRGLVDEQGGILRTGRVTRIAIANPKLSPYGAAAIETLRAMGILQDVSPRFVQGENIAQAFQFVASQNATMGFVALSQVITDGAIPRGSAWVVPGHFHAPIRQDAILLAKGKDDAAARALMAYLRGDRARALIRSLGYGL